MALVRPKCLHCSLTFHSYSGFTRHCKRVHCANEENSACSHCNLEVNSLSQLKKHARFAHNQTVSGAPLNLALCGLCNSYQEVRKMWEHIRINHLRQKSAVKICPMCGEVIQRKEWREHCAFQHTSVPCFCCRAVFGSFAAYNSHFNDSHNLSIRKRRQTQGIVCGLCLQSHCRLSSFVRHIFTVHLAVAREGEVCLYCWQVLPLVHLNEHLHTQHAHIQCLRCKKTLTRSAYSQHFTAHLAAMNPAPSQANVFNPRVC